MLRSPVLTILFTSFLMAQGPGSCGLHLDVLADHTSTHAAISHLAGAPGSGAGMAPGAPGNPYTAYATPGSAITLRLSAPGGVLGPAPFGPGATVTIMWALPTTSLAIPGGTIESPCQPGQPLVISVLPLGGVIVDGNGLFGPAPAGAAIDPGWPQTLSLPLTYPALAPGIGPVVLQAIVERPIGGFALSNAVAILDGPSPWETSLKPALVTCGSGSALSSGTTVVPTPAGFAFYGVPSPTMNVHVDGFVDFLAPGAPAPCDPTGEYTDMGCAGPTPEARPRIDVNHFDGNLLPFPGLALVPDLTREVVPATATTPERVILRWKHVVDEFNITAGPPFP